MFNEWGNVTGFNYPTPTQEFFNKYTPIHTHNHGHDSHSHAHTSSHHHSHSHHGHPGCHVQENHYGQITHSNHRNHRVSKYLCSCYNCVTARQICKQSAYSHNGKRGSNNYYIDGGAAGIVMNFYQ